MEVLGRVKTSGHSQLEGPEISRWSELGKQGGGKLRGPELLGKGPAF